MTYSFATGGDGWVMVPCMTVFLAEVEQCVKDGLLDVTNLGQIASPQHLADAPVSRHNPAKAPDGNRYVCAADFGGTDYAKLANFHQALYKAGDPRVYNHGFCQWGDGYGLSWYDGGREYTGRDVGHCHFDVTMAFPQLSANWWVDALASTAPWGLADYLRTGQLTGHTTDSGDATPITSEEDDMTPDQAKQLEAVYNRLTARTDGDSAQWMFKDTDGVWKPTANQNTPGAVKIQLLDSLDGQTLNSKLEQVLSRLAALEAK